MTRVEDLVHGRELKIPLDELQAQVSVLIQRHLDQDGYADREVMVDVALALRELEDLRKLVNDRKYLKWRSDQYVEDMRNVSQP